MIKYNKNAKMIHFAYFLMVFVILFLTVCFMTQYKDLFIYKSAQYEIMGFLDPATHANNNNNTLYKQFVDGLTTNPIIKDFYLGLGYTTNTMDTFNDSALVIYNFYMLLQNVNTSLLVLTVISAICVAAMYIASNQSRRIYYKSNLVVGILCPAIIAGFSLYVILINTLCIPQLYENLPLLRAMHYAVNTNSSFSVSNIAEVLENGSISAFTLILTDVILAGFVAYSVFVAIYSYKRYVVCAEERKEIIERAVSSNE